jgi:hypothetical protein
MRAMLAGCGHVRRVAAASAALELRIGDRQEDPRHGSEVDLDQLLEEYER